jgi:hypothetical protein
VSLAPGATFRGWRGRAGGEAFGALEGLSAAGGNRTAAGGVCCGVAGQVAQVVSGGPGGQVSLWIRGQATPWSGAQLVPGAVTDSRL